MAAVSLCLHLQIYLCHEQYAKLRPLGVERTDWNELVATYVEISTCAFKHTFTRRSGFCVLVQHANNTCAIRFLCCRLCFFWLLLLEVLNDLFRTPNRSSQKKQLQISQLLLQDAQIDCRLGLPMGAASHQTGRSNSRRSNADHHKSKIKH